MHSDVAWGGLVALVAALVMAPGFIAVGNVFDEGILLAFPSRVNLGQLPYRDFETFYGPGGPVLLAAAFRLFGAHLGTERAVGFLFRIVLIVALYCLFLRWGRRAAVGGSLIALTIVGMTATYDDYIVALALCVLALIVASKTVGDGPVAAFAGAGFLAGLSGLFRVEAALWMLPALIPFAIGAPRRRLALGALFYLLALSPYLPLGLAAGITRIERVEHDLRATGAARRLPVEIAHAKGFLFIGFILALILVAIAVTVSLRARAPNRRLLTSVWILAAVQVSFALWFFEPDHVANAEILALAATPAAVIELLTLLPERRIPRLLRYHRGWVAPGVACFTIVCLLVPGFIRDNLKAEVDLAIGRDHSYLVSFHGRDFRMATPQIAHNVLAAVETANRVAPPGGSLLVAPSDMRRTDANDPFIYYLLPRLRPAAFFIELDPPDSKPGSGLAAAVLRANVLILDSHFNGLVANNGTKVFGSDVPNEIVKRDFCLRGRYGTFQVLTRCR